MATTSIAAESEVAKIDVDMEESLTRVHQVRMTPPLCIGDDKGTIRVGAGVTAMKRWPAQQVPCRSFLVGDPLTVKSAAEYRGIIKAFNGER